jgi:hypothetical protein
VTIDDLGQHHQTLLKRLIRSNPEEKFDKIVEEMLERSSRMSQLRAVRSQIDGWQKQYLDVIPDTLPSGDVKK